MFILFTSTIQVYRYTVAPTNTCAPVFAKRGISECFPFSRAVDWYIWVLNPVFGYITYRYF